MGVKFIHTADLHLERDDPFRLDILSWILSKTEQVADALIIAGDLFESDIEASFLREKVRKIFEKAEKSLVLILPGNHDYLSYSPEINYGERVILLNNAPSRINLKGVEIVGIPFHPQLEFSQCIEELKSKPDVVIAHGTLYDRNSPDIYVELGDEAKYMPIYRWDVKDRMRYLALGHYHSRLTHLSFGETQVVYPGSPVATSRRSIGQRFIVLVSFDSKGQVKIEKIPVDICPYWERIEWMVFPGKEEEKLEEIEQQIKKIADKKVMLDGRVKGSIKISEAEFKERIKKIEGKYRSSFKNIHLSCEIRYWAHILQNPILKLFVEKLKDIGGDEQVKEKALELTLSALERLRG